MPPSLVALLHEHRIEQAERRLLAGPAWADGGFVFENGTGRPLDPDTFSKVFRRAVAGAGLDGVRLHDLRHAFATMHVAAGTNLRLIADLLGHATPGFTLSVYAHGNDEAAAAAAQVTKRLLGWGESGANRSRR